MGQRLSLFALSKTDMNPLDAATAWIGKGFSPIPVPPRSKKPVLKDWHRLEITIDTASQYFSNSTQNIGVLLGDKYGCTDIDCDCPEAIRTARELLPETGLIFGRDEKRSRISSIGQIHRSAPSGFMIHSTARV